MGPNIMTFEVVNEIVQLWSILLRRESQVVKFSSYVYDVKYVYEGCPWRVSTMCHRIFGGSRGNCMRLISGCHVKI
jgi:hypothetical protein